MTPLAIVLPDLTATTRLALPGGGARVRVLPAGGAVVIHALMLAIVARLVVAPLVSPPPQRGIAVMLTPVVALGAAPLRANTPPPPRLGAISPLAVGAAQGRAIAHVPIAPAAHAAPAADRTSVPAATAPMPAPQAPPAHAAPVDADALLPGLENRIDAAVQRAAVLPASAQRQRREGRARLRFTYRDGAVGDVRIVASSASRALDEAALAAVREANVPPVPAPLRGRRLDLLVWINFRLAAG